MNVALQRRKHDFQMLCVGRCDVNGVDFSVKQLFRALERAPTDVQGEFLRLGADSIGDANNLHPFVLFQDFSVSSAHVTRTHNTNSDGHDYTSQVC